MQYRQGDVLLVEVPALPATAVRVSVRDRIVLALGEVTGHAHVISPLVADLYTLQGEKYVAARLGAKLTHEEHSTIEIKPGRYRVVQQRRYVEPSQSSADWDYAYD
jgi:hypothetical protein